MMDLASDGAGAGAVGDAGGAADLVGGMVDAGAQGGAQNDGGAQGGAGDGGAQGAGADGGAQGDGGQGGAEPDWYRTLSTDADGESASNLDWMRAKGFKDLNATVKALRSAEKAIHDTGRVKVPGEGATAEEVGAFRKALGVPDEPTGYEFTAPKDAEGKPIELDNDLLASIAQKAHGLNVPKAALEELVNAVVQRDLDRMSANDAEQQRAAAAWVKAQGQGWAEKQDAINRAGAHFGISRQEMIALRGAWGPERALEFMSGLGLSMREDTLVTGGRASFGTSAVEAQAELDGLKKDKSWAQKALIKGSPENMRYVRLRDTIADAAEREARR